MKSENVLITGGIGAIGSHVLRKFVTEGIHPSVIDLRKDFTLVSDVESGFDYIPGDITDPELLHDVVEGREVGCIVHFSSVLGPVCRSDPRRAWDINVGGVLNVLETARLLNVKRVLYASSKSAYGQFTGVYGHPDFRPADENHPLKPTSFYGSTKVAAEVMGREYRRSYGIEFSAFRFASTFGPGKSNRHTSQSSIGRMIDCACSGVPFELGAGGDQKNDYVYNADIGNALYLAFRAQSVGPEYNIGSGQLRTLKEARDIICRRHPDASIQVGSGLADSQKPGELSYGLLDIRRAREELRYSPEYNLEAGIADYESKVKDLGLDQTI